MRRFFLFPFLMFAVFWGESVFSTGILSLSSKEESQIQQIDAQLKELEEMKRGFEARASYHEDQANRLQFDDQTYLEMRRHTQIAEENRAKAAAVQKEIDRLETERNKIIN